MLWNDDFLLFPYFLPSLAIIFVKRDNLSAEMHPYTLKYLSKVVFAIEYRKESSHWGNRIEHNYWEFALEDSQYLFKIYLAKSLSSTPWGAISASVRAIPEVSLALARFRLRDLILLPTASLFKGLSNMIIVVAGIWELEVASCWLCLLPTQNQRYRPYVLSWNLPLIWPPRYPYFLLTFVLPPLL